MLAPEPLVLLAPEPLPYPSGGVSTSADDAAYATQANVVDGIGAVQVVPLPSNVSARYLRITCTSTVPGVDSSGAARPTWVSFWEVSVLGP